MTTLLTCSAGGHLKQLHKLWPRFGLDDDVVWMTFDTALSRSLLVGQQLQLVDYSAPRQVGPLIKSAKVANDLVRRYDIDRVISTGAGLALSGFAPVLARGGRCHYIESATRVQQPSMTGTVVQYLPRVARYTQYPEQASKRWSYGGSVFDGYQPAEQRQPRAIERIVVSVGTTESYGFRRMIESLSRIVPNDVEVLWQTGATDVTGLPIDARPSVAFSELSVAIEQADVVVSHAGTGSTLVTLENGKLPLLVPRRQDRGEHYDNHQVQLAAEMASRGLAVVVDADALAWSDIERAAAGATCEVAEPPPFKLR